MARAKFGADNPNFRHGQCGSRTYQAWLNMISRCTNPEHDHYYAYGGRGISVHEPWFDFAVFFEDMGECPDGYSIDRSRVNGDYCPDNCEWIPLEDQARNKRLRRAKGTIAKAPNGKYRFQSSTGDRVHTTSWGTLEEALDAQADYIFEREMHIRLGMTEDMLR